MGFKGSERGFGHPFIRKVGVGDFGHWLGVRPDGDPASLPPERLRVAENIRYRHADATSRGGQEKIKGLTGAANGIFPPEFQYPTDPTGTKMFLANVVLPNGGQSQVLKYDTAISPTPQLVEGFSTPGVVPVGIAIYNQYCYYTTGATGSGPKTWKVRRVGITGTPVPADAFTITFLNDSDKGPFIVGPANGKLWILYGYNESLTPTNGRIYSWDGIALVQEQSFSLADTGNDLFFMTGFTSGGFAPFRGGWVCVPLNQPGQPGLRIIFRDSNGVLNFVPVDLTSNPSLDPTTVRINALEPFSEYRSNLYMGGSGVIWKFDGNAVVQVHTIPNFEDCYSCVSFDGFLYYVWAQIVGGINIRIGRYDGTTWNDNFGIVVAAGGGGKKLAVMAGNVFLLDLVAAIGFRQSSGTDLTTWSIIDNTNGRQYTLPAVF